MRVHPRHHSRDRFRVLVVLVLLVFAGILARLGYLQVVQARTYHALAESQRTKTSDLLPRRGTVYLSEEGSGKPFPVATTRNVLTAFAVPRDIKDLDTTVDRLVDILLGFEKREEERRLSLWAATGALTPAELAERRAERAEVPPEDRERREEERRLGLSNDLRRRLGNPLDPYEPLVASYERLDPEAIAELESADLPGIEFREVPERYAPEGTLAAHVLGIVRAEGFRANGEYGIEGFMDDLLTGDAGFLAEERDVVGRWISVGGVNLRSAKDGADLVLTLDRIVQMTAERVAQEGRERYRAEQATVIVMDPSTGAITALANTPTFDPSHFGDVLDVGTLRNAAISDLFEPGSAFKPLVMAVAMDRGVVDPWTTMVDSGPLRIGGFTIDTYDGKHHGRVTMTEVLEHSNNVGMVWVAQQVGAEALYGGLRRLGIGEKTGVPLEGEAVQSLPPPDTWDRTRLATVGFGQGVTVTPLQVLTASAALVNGGTLYAPRIIREIRHPDGRVETVEPRRIRQAVAPETATRVSAMLTSVVEKGVGQLAKVAGYYVGGKTGTAQVVDPETGRYARDRKIISFIGFAPAEDPRFIALIVLKNPAGLSLASGTAAPMFRDLARQLLEYYRIPPSRGEIPDPIKALRRGPRGSARDDR